MKRIFFVVAAFFLTLSAYGQAPTTQCNSFNVNATYSDNLNNVQYLCTTAGWKANIGSGAPTVSCGARNFGAPYTDVIGSVGYQCGNSGWFNNSGAGGPPSGTASNALAGTYPGPSLAPLGSGTATALFASLTGCATLNYVFTPQTGNCQPQTGGPGTAGFPFNIGTTSIAGTTAVPSLLGLMQFSAQVIDGVSYATLYPGTPTAQILACASDALNNANGNYTNICNAMGETGNLILTSEIDIGNQSGFFEQLLLPCSGSWQSSASSGVTLKQFGGAEVDGCAVSGISASFYLGATSGSNLFAIYNQVGSSTPYIHASGFEALNSSGHSTTSGYTIVVDGNPTGTTSPFSDASLVSSVNANDFNNPSGGAILFRNVTSGYTWENSAFNANGGGVPVTFQSDSTSYVQKVNLIADTLVDPGTGKPVVSCTDSRTPKVSYVDIAYGYTETNTTDTTGNLVTTTCQQIGFHHHGVYSNKASNAQHWASTATGVTIDDMHFYSGLGTWTYPVTVEPGALTDTAGNYGTANPASVPSSFGPITTPGCTGCGLTALTQDVTATGPGSANATVAGIGGVLLSTLGNGLYCFTAGVPIGCTNVSIPGSFVAGTNIRSGVNSNATCTGAVTFDATQGNFFYCLLAGNVTSSTFINPPTTLSGTGQPFYMQICQPASGSVFTFAYPTTFNGVLPVTNSLGGCTTQMFTVNNGIIQADGYNSANCIGATTTIACGQALQGEMVFAVGTNPSVTLTTTAWGAHSQLVFSPDQTKGTDLGVTCNTLGAAGRFDITGGTPGTNVVVTWYGTIATNPLCGTWTIRNL